jgi:ABC-type uncharacterized transport system substrate-binding protein
MRRRALLAVVLGGLLAGPAGHAQAPPAVQVGVLMQGGPHRAGVEGLREGLKAAGLGPDRVALIVRDGGGDLQAVEAAARELERGGVRVIVAFSTSVALAAQRATTEVPIVFAAGSDPVAFGLVDSIAKPGGRITGVHAVIADATAKRFELLRELLPGMRRAVTFYNPGNAAAVRALAAAREAARAFAVELVERQVASPEAIRQELAALATARADVFFFVSDSTVIGQDQLIIDAANALRLPTMAYEWDLVVRGALAGYGINYRELGRGAARYVVGIAAGTPPRDLAVEAVSRPALAINLKTATALGIEVPQALLARADEVIE